MRDCRVLRLRCALIKDTEMLRQLSRAVNPIRSARSAKSAKSAQSVRGYASSRPAQLPVFNTNADKVWMATSAFVTIGGVVWLTSPGEDAHHDSHHDDAHHQVSEKVCVCVCGEG